MEYKHNFKDGDIVTDTKYNETFEFNNRVDGFAAENRSEDFRLATKEEEQEYRENSK